MRPSGGRRSRTRRLFTAGLGTETNTFSPIRTTLTSFADHLLVRPGERMPGGPTLDTGPQWAARRFVEEAAGWELVEGTVAFAMPAGPTVRRAYEALRDEILAQLRAATPVDAVALSLHGAMVADGYDDCEGDILHRVRDIVGPSVAVGAVLDPHAHLSPTMVEAADLLVCFKLYPHVDFAERGTDLIRLLTATAEGRVRPHTAVFDCRQIALYHTTHEPMRSLVAQLATLEGRDGVLSISIVHGFPWGDVADLGTKVVVVTDARPERGAAVAADLGRRLVTLRGRCAPAHLPVAEGLARARTSARGPVVLAETFDNPGGGAAGDSTVVLAAMLAGGMTDACIGPVWDPVAATYCAGAGVGASLEIRVGGKASHLSGHPIDLRVTVLGVNDDAWQTFGGARVPLGLAVGVRSSEGLALLLTDRRTQGFSPELFREGGIEPCAARYVVVKSSHHFYDAFARLGGDVVYLDGPGTVGQDLRRLTYRKRTAGLWPFDDAETSPFRQVENVSSRTRNIHPQARRAATASQQGSPP
jgi:microcystin degradation protein MlrC